MGEIIQMLNDIVDTEDLNEFEKLVKLTLGRDLSEEEVLKLEQEEGLLERYVKEIIQGIEMNLKDDEKEKFYSELGSSLIQFVKSDEAKIAILNDKDAKYMNRFEKFEIINSIMDTKKKIEMIESIDDKDEKGRMLEKQGTEFLREYMNTPNITIDKYKLGQMIVRTRDKELIREYLRINSDFNRAWIIRKVEDIEFIKECLEDEKINLNKKEKFSLIQDTNDPELIENAIFDESLNLTNQEKESLLKNINDTNVVWRYIHDPDKKLSKNELEKIITNTGDETFIKRCILDKELEFSREDRVKLIGYVNSNTEIIKELLDSEELNLDEKEKVYIVINTKNISFIEEYIEAKGKELEYGSRNKLLHCVVKDSEFIEKTLKQEELKIEKYDKLSLIQETKDQELIKKCIYDKELEFEKYDICSLIEIVEDEKFLEKCLQDKELNLQSEQIYSIVNRNNVSQEFIKKCIKNKELDIDNDMRYSLLKEKINDSEFIMNAIKEKYESIDLDSRQKEDLLLLKLSEEFVNENLQEVLDLIKENGGSYKEFRLNSEYTSAIYNNIETFLELEGIEPQNIRNYVEIINRMFQKNQEVVKKIDFRILDPKYITTLGEDKVNQISCYSKIQDEILNMDDKTYEIFLECLNHRLEENSQWTTFANDIIKNLSSGEYESLIQNCDIENVNKENLISILQSRNLFNVTTTEEVNNIENIRKEYCDGIINGDIQICEDNEILNSYSQIDKKRFAILEKVFGQDIEKTKSIISAYGEDIEELTDKEENEEIIDYIRTLKLIMEEENEDTLTKMYNESEIMSNVNVELMESKLKSAYCEKLNEGLFQITDETKKVGENIYEAGTDFNMIITSIAAYYNNEPENYERDWNKRLINTQHFCTSYIRNDMIGTAEIPHLCYGFIDMAEDSLMLAGNVDLSSGQDKMKASSRNNEKYYIPNNLVNKTNRHNELCYNRYQNGKKKQPDYIVVFREKGKIDNWEKAIKAQKEWKDLPIVIVDKDKCLEKEKEKVQDMVEEYRKTSDVKILENISQKIRNNRQTQASFCDNINTKKLQEKIDKESKRIAENPQKNKRKVTQKDLEKNYEMVDVQERRKEARKISQIYSRLNQIKQREGGEHGL